MKNLYLACKKTHLADSILLDWTLPMSFLSEIRLNLMTLEIQVDPFGLENLKATALADKTKKKE